MYAAAIKLIVCLIVLSNQATSKPDDGRPLWDYLVLSLEWPPTFCLKSKCILPKGYSNFNIHGLWPTIWPAKQISECPGAPIFNSSNLEPIFTDLQREWADLKDFDHPVQFWKYEWSKHGVCAVADALIGNELHYFQLALKFKQTTSILDRLVSLGIRPSNVTVYQTDNVVDQLRRAYGVNPLLRCQMDGKSRQARLIEVRFCISPLLVLIDCPGNLLGMSGLDQQTPQYDIDQPSDALNGLNSLERPATTVRMMKLLSSDNKNYGDSVPWIKLQPALKIVQPNKPDFTFTVECPHNFVFPSF